MLACDNVTELTQKGSAGHVVRNHYGIGLDWYDGKVDSFSLKRFIQFHITV